LVRPQRRVAPVLPVRVVRVRSAFAAAGTVIPDGIVQARRDSTASAADDGAIE